ncbi:MAG: hypothetical protein CYPHOPRED_004886 [Cyphobasidiales sp. Tagirdzhanova-0007]|nr:MAG: hypothetical protein CYPHOPRED_004886 [Cyphobasidiales sp. Tagirdzhanova-0007]
MSHRGGIQGVTQVSIMGQFPVALLDQVLRRLQAHSEHMRQFTLRDDVFMRGTYTDATTFREEDVLRIHCISSQGRNAWSMNALSRPLPIRDNSDVLIRAIASIPVLEGNAGALAVALGYSERRFAFTRKGYSFSSAGGLTIVRVYQIYEPTDLSEPLDPAYYIMEVCSHTAHKPILLSEAAPIQTLRENATQRTLDFKKVMLGLVDLSRVE